MIGLVCENIANINIKEVCDNNITLFSNSQASVDDPNMCLYSKCMSYDFEGTLLCVTLHDTISILDNNMCDKKVFWVCSVDWHKYSTLAYSDILTVFFNNDIKIVASTKEISDVLETFVRKPDGIMESIDVQKILEV
jgi:hypothetical protein